MDSLPAEQAFGNLPIAISLQPSVEGSYRKFKPLAPPARQVEMRRTCITTF